MITRLSVAQADRSVEQAAHILLAEPLVMHARRVIGFFNAYREGRRVTRNFLGDIAEQFQNWVKNRCQKWGAPILDAPEGSPDDFVDPYLAGG